MYRRDRRGRNHMNHNDITEILLKVALNTIIITVIVW